MPRSLPDNPNLEFLRKQAKDLHKAHRNGDPTCCDILRNLRQSAGRSDADILAANVSLSETQFALAMDYGFKSWDEMKKHASPGNGPTGGSVVRDGSRLYIAGVPQEHIVGGIWPMCGFPTCLRAILEFKGVARKYLDDVVFGAITGQPFRFWFARDWGSCLPHTYEQHVGTIAAEVLGFDHHLHEGSGGSMDAAARDPEAVARVWRALAAEIDKGNPAVIFGGETPPRQTAVPVVITGYDEQAGLVFFLPRVPGPRWRDDDPECQAGIQEERYRARPIPDESNWFGTGFGPDHTLGAAGTSFFAFGERIGAVDDRGVAVKVLQRAVALSMGRVRDELRSYRCCGREAYDLLIQCLGHDDDGNVGLDGRKRSWEETGQSGWVDAMGDMAQPEFRRSAAAFVSRCAEGFGRFPKEAAARLAASAANYRESAEHLAALWEILRLPPNSDDEAKTEVQIRALTSSATRAKLAKVFRLIRDAEVNGAAEIEAALAAVE